MRILGIDPGLATIGLGLITASSPHTVTVEEWLTIETKAGGENAQRLAEIAKDLNDYLDQTKPELAVVERLFFATNQVSAIEVAQARGVILLCLEQHGIPMLEPTPLQLKGAITGDGQADKRQVQDMMVRVLKLKELPKPVDAADALALAYYGALAGMTTVA